MVKNYKVYIFGAGAIVAAMILKDEHLVNAVLLFIAAIFIFISHRKKNRQPKQDRIQVNGKLLEIKKEGLRCTLLIEFKTRQGELIENHLHYDHDQLPSYVVQSGITLPISYDPAKPNEFELTKDRLMAKITFFTSIVILSLLAILNLYTYLQHG
jgi:hypothetical protein